MNNKVQQIINWIKDEKAKAHLEAKGYNECGDLKTSNLFLSRAWAFAEIEQKLTVLLYSESENSGKNDADNSGKPM